ncbi:post-GPI attachment to proteins factor 2-like [Ruditapes philippinarum]|uniref:post-GPI attachment to proteins factor 2-like n=1 Tax=Ruditapes philippinarum TaxID=129788 RepID=UPI00295AA3B4|nr:post-GPI attachment to proteins factor 2-like [Ruditapes philippinarum]
MGQKEKTISDDLLLVPFATYSIVTVGLPGLSLAYCFWSAFLFSNPSEINDTDCNVTNNIPSVSAVTGVKPQAYVWRICIGLHSTPRFFVGIMYYNYYKKSLPFIKKNLQGLYKFLMRLCFWLYTIECSCLLAVSCISNKENYPLHEKIFVVFMITSIAHMVFGTTLYRWSRHKPMTDREKKSFFWKKVMLAWISLSTVGLLYYFVQHRVYCIPGAFSIFSVFEYMIAYANMGYHVTGYLEFCDKTLIAADIQPETVKNGNRYPIRNGRSKHD